MTFVKTFEEFQLFESLSHDTDTRVSIDQKVNDWLRANKDVEVLDIKVTCESSAGSRRLVYVVLYHKNARAPEVPTFPRKGTVPTVQATVVYAGQKRSVECMAGLFGVPEGWRFAPHDDETAPKVLLSPDCDLTPFADLFGNVAAKELS